MNLIVAGGRDFVDFELGFRIINYNGKLMEICHE